MKSPAFYWLLFSLLLFGCEKEPSPPHQTTIIDATGLAVPISPIPLRIISCAPSITRCIYSLKEQDRLVGVTKYCKLPSGESKQVIGSVLTQDIEQIILLKPDLVLATKDINQPAVVDKLRKLGIRVFVLGQANSWRDIKDSFIQIATLLGQVKKAEEIIANCESRLSDLAIRHSQSTIRPPPKVFFQASEQLHTAAKDTYIDEAISYAGGINIAHNALGRWPMLSVEEVIQQDPDLIVITTMGDIEKQAEAAWQKFPSLKAVKHHKIAIIDADICCQPTPQNFIRLVEIISEKLTQ